MLVVHLDGQVDDLQYWRIVVPDNIELQNKILNECHVVPYTAHPGVQHTLNKMRQIF